MTGCDPIVCERPETPGYAGFEETNVDLSLGPFDVTVNCATHYEGDAVASTCNNTDQRAYTVSGCAPIVCSSATDIVGYDPPTEHNLDMAAGFSISTQCATNYEGTAVGIGCTEHPVQKTPYKA